MIKDISIKRKKFVYKNYVKLLYTFDDIEKVELFLLSAIDTKIENKVTLLLTLYYTEKNQEFNTFLFSVMYKDLDQWKKEFSVKYSNFLLRYSSEYIKVLGFELNIILKKDLVSVVEKYDNHFDFLKNKGTENDYNIFIEYFILSICFLKFLPENERFYKKNKK